MLTTPSTSLKSTVPATLPPARVIAPAPAVGGGAPADEGYVNPRELLDVLARRWRVMLIALLLVLAAGLLWTKTRQRLYASMSEIVVRQVVPNSPSSSDLPALNTIEDLSTNRSITTQMHLLQSGALFMEALRALPPALLKESQPSSVEVRNVTADNVLAITVTAHTPRTAAALANSLVDTFIQHDLAENRQTIITALDYVDKEMARVGAELQTARQRLAEFEAQYSVSGDEGTLQQQTEQVAKLSDDIGAAASETAVARETTRSLLEKLAHEPHEIVADTTEERNPTLDKIDAQLQELERQRLDLLLEYQPAAPEVTKVEGLIRATRQQRTEYLATRVASKTHSINPIYQQLEQQYLAASTNADAAQIRVAVLQRALAQQRTALAGLPDLVMRAAEIQNTVKQLESTYALLSDNYQTLRISEASHVSNVRVLSRAEENPAPVSPNLPRNMAVALVLGLLLAVGLAAVLEAFDDRIHTSVTLEHLTNLPVLAHVPHVREGLVVQEMAALARPNPVLEGVRLLRSRLYHIARETPLGVIAVTSAGPQEGKSTIAVNLAITLAMDGKRVVLVDTDLRRPSLYKYFSLSREVGLTSVVTGTHTLDEALCATSYAQVHVLPAGPLPHNPPEMLNLPQTRALFRELAERFDVVILDAPPIAGLSDTLVLTAAVNGVLLVVSADRTRRGLLQLCLSTLEQIGAPLLGIVLNIVPFARHPYHAAYAAYYAVLDGPREGE